MALRMQQPMVRIADTSIARTAPKTTDPLYGSAEYKRWEAGVKDRDGHRCVDPTCPGPHYPGQKVYADHLREVRDGGARFDLTNGITRCARSHSLKTAAVRAARQRGTPGLARCDAVAPRNNVTPGGIKISGT